MKYSVALVDSSKKFRTRIKQYIERLSAESNVLFSISEFSDGDEISSDYEAVDIIILEMEMKRQDGIDAAKIIMKFDKKAAIIFTSDSKKRAVEGYSVNASDYLIKPMSLTLSAEIGSANKSPSLRYFPLQ